MTDPVRWFPADPSNVGGPLRTHRLLVIHCGEVPLAKGVAFGGGGGPYFQNPGLDASAHRYFGPGGQSAQMVDINTTAWHCGPGGNGLGTGYEHCGRASMSKAQWLSPEGWEQLRTSGAQLAADAKAMGWQLSDLRWLSLTELAQTNMRGLCFTAGTLVLARRGLVPVESIVVGDEVWTHEDRWRPVTSTMDREADVVKVVGQGHDGLRVTPEHPFLTRKAEIVRVRDETAKSGRNMVREFGPEEWTEAGNLVGSHWMTPTLGGTGEPPAIAGVPVTPEMMWAVGLWVADGHTSAGGRIHFTIANHQLEEFSERINASGLNLARYSKASPTGDACYRVRSAAQPELQTWLHEHFGKLATGKTVPAWLLLSHEKYRDAFLAGYTAGDGYQHPKYAYNEPSTASRSLAIGIKMLAASLGYGASLYAFKARTGEIHGRAVVGRGGWKVRIQNIGGPRTQFASFDGRVLGKVKKVTPDGRARVYNISVAEDESYVADGFIVHNCTHNDIRLAFGGTDHSDPGPNFPYAELLSLVRQAFTGTTPTPTPQGDTNDMADITAAQIQQIADRVLDTSFDSAKLGAKGEARPTSLRNIAKNSDFTTDKIVNGIADTPRLVLEKRFDSAKQNKAGPKRTTSLEQSTAYGDNYNDNITGRLDKLTAQVGALLEALTVKPAPVEPAKPA